MCHSTKMLMNMVLFPNFVCCTYFADIHTPFKNFKHENIEVSAFVKEMNLFLDNFSDKLTPLLEIEDNLIIENEYDLSEKLKFLKNLRRFDLTVAIVWNYKTSRYIIAFQILILKYLRF
ncbi:hypothetical protein H311_02329 [Anncaliia algerae PRA109]|nr:hypothetical protein H311_02329 [Anncaliia algerae PRA109]